MVIFSLLIFILAFIFLIDKLYDWFYNKNLDIQIHFANPTAFEGEDVSLIETVVNQKWLPLPWLAVKFQVSKHLLFHDDIGKISDNYYRNDVFSIMPYQKVTRRLSFRCQQRGYYSIRSIVFSSSNILVQKTLSAVLPNQTSITVYPSLLSAHPFEPLLRQVSGNIIMRRYMNPDPFMFKGIREYQPFDDFKQINFKATAKLNQLMVNVNDYTVSSSIVILLNLETYRAYPDLFVYEQSIRLAATFAEYFTMSENIPVRLVSGSRDILTKNTINTGSGESVHHLHQIYDALARIDLEQNPEPIKNLIWTDLENKNCEDAVYILISAYQSEDLQECFYQMQNDFTNIHWIIPVSSGTHSQIPPSEHVQTWEVESNVC